MDERERAGVRAAYERYSASALKRRAWDAGNPGNEEIRAELVERSVALAGDDLRAGDVLDAGCGTGWWLERLAAGGVPPERLFGVDLLGDRAAAAARRVPGATVLTADAASLPFADARFAAVTLFVVLSSLPNAEAVGAVLEEARRVLAPGRPLLIWEPRIPSTNRGTRWIRRRELVRSLGELEADEAVTVLPPLARRLGGRTAALYPRLAALHTHRLVLARQRASET
jgi:SAM-dependent methyltransferase